jgi:hypothetical protein
MQAQVRVVLCGRRLYQVQTIQYAGAYPAPALRFIRSFSFVGE